LSFVSHKVIAIVSNTISIMIGIAYFFIPVPPHFPKAAIPPVFRAEFFITFR